MLSGTIVIPYSSSGSVLLSPVFLTLPLLPLFSGLLSKSLLGPDVAFANPELSFRAAAFAGDFVPVTFYRLLWDCCAQRGKAENALAMT